MGRKAERGSGEGLEGRKGSALGIRSSYKLSDTAEKPMWEKQSGEAERGRERILQTAFQCTTLVDQLVPQAGGDEAAAGAVHQGPAMEQT